MAVSTLEPGTRPCNASAMCADELHDCARHAAALEAILFDVRAVFDAIETGGLLMSLPSDAEDANRHNAGVSILDIARRRLAEEEAIPGTDLSIKLRVMADNLHREAGHA